MLETVYNLYRDNGVILEGHFKLSSGRHSNLYINKDAIYCNPELLEETVNSVIDTIETAVDTLAIDVVTGPAIAGAVLAAPIAMKMWKIFVYPEKVNKIEYKEYMAHGERHERAKIVSNEMEFRRGYNHIIKDENIFLVEDIITTGASVQRTADAIKECGGRVVAVCAIWNRTGWKLEGAENLSLIDIKVESWEKDDCPMCKDGIKLTDPKAL